MEMHKEILHNSKIIFKTEIFAVIAWPVKSPNTMYGECINQVETWSFCARVRETVARTGAPAVCGFIYPMEELWECIP